MLNHPIISERYFFPRKAHLESPYLVDAADGSSLACRYIEIPNATKTLVHFHGNGEIVSDYRGPLEEAFKSLGCNICFVEYRGYGASTGIPALEGMLDDVDCLFKALNTSEERLIVMGRSVGSLYAVHLVHRFPLIAGLVLESGIADVLERLLLRMRPEELEVSLAEMEAAVNASFNQQKKLSSYKGPLLVLHAEKDFLVDVSHGKRLHQWGGGSQKELNIFPDGDHNSIMMVNWQDYWQKMKSFIDGVNGK